MLRTLVRFALLVGAAYPLALAAMPAPEMTALPTGSELATWSVPPEKQSHATPIIFLHGGPGLFTEARRLDEGAAFRAAGFKTLYFDQAGGGQSKRLKASEYTLDRAVADLEALRISLGQEKLILWGNSYGAALATLYATRFPERVAGLILTSPGAFPGTNVKRNYSGTNRDGVSLGKELSAAVNKIDKLGAAAEPEVSQIESGKLLDAITSQELIGAMVCKGAKIAAPPLSGGGNLFVNRILQKQLEKMKFKEQTAPAALRAPAIVIRAACDFLPPENAERYRKYFGASAITIDGTGHGMLENRAKVDDAFRAFALGPLAVVP